MVGGDALRNVLALLKAGKIDRSQANRLITAIQPSVAAQPPAINRVCDGKRGSGDGDGADVAIIGIAGAFPGSRSVDAFWAQLVANAFAVTEVPNSRWDWRALHDRIYCRWGGFLEGIDQFDASFFNVSPLEAECMDPQQRLFLQEAYHAFEDAGYSEERLKGVRCGVYVGTMHNDYLSLLSARDDQNNNHYEMTGNHASILAARVSYYFDLKGPCMTVDTACSSSLVALHLACQSLRQGEADIALVGGVTLYIDPRTYELMCKANMLSPTGQCRTFDNSADGFVPAEACVAVVVKPLRQAQCDRDRIYGVIKASAINQDGKTNGITAPSGVSQIDLITSLFERTKLNPEKISYIETHGTGTKLGDPIEVQSLIDAYRPYTSRKEYCGLGSVKSNIGHTSAAAGLTSLVKVLKSFEHDLIPATLHYRQCNEHLDLADTPFFINQRNRAWVRESGSLRFAALSSFGFSGTNAHAILADYPESTRKSSTLRQLAFPFSARSVSSLKRHITDVVRWLRTDTVSRLEDISYTACCRRTHHSRRVCIIAANRDELIAQLEAAVESLDDYGEYIERSIRTIPNVVGKGLSDLVARHLAGENCDFAPLVSGMDARVVGFPGYAFDTKPFWSTKVDTAVRLRIQAGTRSAETSGCGATTAELTINPKSRLVHGHTINGQAVLPGAFLVQWILGMFDHPVCISELNLLRPVIIGNEPAILRIRWKDDQRFDVFSGNDEGCHIASGSVADLQRTLLETVDPKSTWDKLPLMMEGKSFYAKAVPSGLHYGDEFRCVTSLRCSDEEFIALLDVRNAERDASAATYLFDAALHSTYCLISDGLYVPYRMQGVVVESALPDRIYVHGTRTRGANESADEFRFKLNIYSADGEKRGSVEALHVAKRAGAASAGRLIHYFHPAWNVVPPPTVLSSGRASPAPNLLLSVSKSHLVGAQAKEYMKSGALRFCASADDLVHAVEELAQNDNVANQWAIDLELVDSERVEVFVDALRVLALRVGRQGFARKSRLLLLNLAGGRDNPLYQAVPAFCRAVNMEMTHVDLRYVEFARIDELSIDHVLAELSVDETTAWIRYEGATRRCLVYEPGSTTPSTIAKKLRGVWVVTGGLGALGSLVARHLASASGVQVIVTGRGSLSPQQTERLQHLQADSIVGRVTYLELNPALPGNVLAVLEKVNIEYGEIKGVVHCAGATRDSLLHAKTLAQMEDVLSPKIAFTEAIDDALTALSQRLDYFIVFSSIAAVVGNIGQCDYAFGNGYLDAFAELRNRRVQQGVAYGHTISINWPLWESDGMQSDGRHLDELKARHGLETLSAEEGLRCFDEILATNWTRICVVKGEMAKLKSLLNPLNTVVHASLTGVQRGKGGLHRVLADVKACISQIIKTPINDIADSHSIDKLGIDSISMVNIIYELEKQYGELPKTLFFEFKTVDALARYLDERSDTPDMEDRDSEKIGQEAKGESSVGVDSVFPTRLSANRVPVTRTEDDDIAVIGVSGEYPGADDLEELWDVLSSGKNCITEIPQERWDAQAFKGSKGQTPGRSYGVWGGFIRRAFAFDSLFFDITPLEAERMDPQERRLLQCGWAALENAGCSLEEIKSRYQQNVGVFIGVMNSDYLLYNAPSFLKGEIQGLGSSNASAANRLSYALDLVGPSIAIDTMCSSSLTSIHLACESLRRGECSLTLAGGVNLLLHPAKYSLLSQGMFLSSEGLCRSFGEGGDGYVPGEGVGVLVLKPLRDAVRDRDYVHGVIKGSAIGHGGRTNGYTVPSPIAQSRVIETAIRRSKVDPDTISYIEAHGTGTSLGDPIEVNGIRLALTNSGRSGSGSRPVRIGSIKSNIGHLESAAGVVAVTKVLLQMKHGLIAPSLHSENLNRNIDFSTPDVEVNRQSLRWEGMSATGPLRAGISSFGAGGSNAHLIIESFTNPLAFSAGRVPTHSEVIILSAKTTDRLVANATSLRHYLHKHARDPMLTLENIAYTLRVGRQPLAQRLVILARSKEELTEYLNEVVRGGAPDHVNRFQTSITAGSVDYTSFVARFEFHDHILSRVEAALRQDTFATFAQYWCDGLDIPWYRLKVGGEARKVPLPGYCFAMDEIPLPSAAKSAVADTLGKRSEGQTTAVPPVSGEVAPSSDVEVVRLAFVDRERLFTDHVIAGRAILSGAAVISEIYTLVRARRDDESCWNIANLMFQKPISYDDRDALFMSLDRRQETWKLVVFIFKEGVYKTCLSAEVVTGTVAARQKSAPQSTVRDINAQEFYEAFASRGIIYGESYRIVASARVGSDSVNAQLMLEVARTHSGSRQIQRAVNIDAGFQTILPLFDPESRGQQALYLPFYVGHIEYLGDSADAVEICVNGGAKPGSSADITIELIDGDGGCVLRMSGVKIREMRFRGMTTIDTGRNVGDYVRKTFSEYLRIPLERLDGVRHLDELGVDSVMMVHLTSKLEERFGELPKTLLFEYQTIDRLSDYLGQRPVEGVQGGDNAGVPRTQPAETLPKELEAYFTGQLLSGTMFLPADNAHRVSGSHPAVVEVAIIGLCGRFPEAKNIAQFWENIRDGRDCISEIPRDRFGSGTSSVSADVKPTYRWGGLISDVDRFDPLLFNIPPAQAISMDPQERLCLETAWSTLEDAGYSRSSLAGRRVGVFVGVMYEEYQLYSGLSEANGSGQALAGSPASAANRISYYFDFKGPCLAIDTMCSSSLYAIHLAADSVRKGESEFVLAGGVNINVHDHKYRLLSQNHFLSPDGRCKAFGCGGEGYVPSEGVGFVLLKRLQSAIDDGDQIYGVIKGSAVNHGGRTSGYTVPSPAAQSDVIRRALDVAGKSAREINYVEAHGTGTSLGDPIEISGLTAVFEESTPDRQFCAIGSVKSNIGHCESASGIAAVAKVLMQMKHGLLAPSIHAADVNPEIDFRRTPFRLQTELREWDREKVPGDSGIKELPRVAGISSFGAGGSNAHVVIEEFRQEMQRAIQPVGPFLFPLSARTEEQLRQVVDNLRAYLCDVNDTGAVMTAPLDEIDRYAHDIARLLAQILSVDSDSIEHEAALEEYGVDHFKLTELARAISETWLKGRRVEISVEDTVSAIALRVGKRPRDEVDVVTNPSQSIKNTALSDIAYTLQVGREQQAKRVLIIASDLGEFINQLDAVFKPSGRVANGVFRGLDCSPANIRERLVQQNASSNQATFSEWERMAQASAAWLNGKIIDWAAVVNHCGCQRTSLPTYPFERRRCWYSMPAPSIMGHSEPPIDRRIAPFLGRREAMSSGQVFVTTFSTADRIIMDHVVSGSTILPGAACIEMALEAAKAVTLLTEPVILVKNVSWAQPIRLSEGTLEVQTEISQDEDQIRFAVRTSGDARNCTGVIQAVPREATVAVSSQRAPQTEGGVVFSADAIYSTFSAHGLNYGPSFRAIEGLSVDGGEVVSRLRLPQHFGVDLARYVLNPYLLDAVFQSSIGLFLSSSERLDGTHLPVHLKEMWIYGELPETVVCRLKRMPNFRSTAMIWVDATVESVDGARLVAISGLGLRKISTTAASTSSIPYSARLADHVWKQSPLPRVESPERSQKVGMYVISIDLPNMMDVVIEGVAQEIQWLHWSTKGVIDPATFRRYVGEVLQLLKQIVGRREKRPRLFVLCDASEPASLLGNMMSAALKTAGMEISGFKGKVIYLNPERLDSHLQYQLIQQELLADDESDEVRYSSPGGVRFTKILRWADYAGVPNGTPVDLGAGVVWITGGLGGLGKILVESFAKIPGVKIVVSGRRDAAPEDVSRLQMAVHYEQCDVSSYESVARAVARIKEKVGAITTLIHCAGVTRDSMLVNKTASHLEAVLSPKIDGVINLDLCTKDEPIANFIAFSSLASVVGNIGQFDYSAANAFLDAFCAHRNRLATLGDRGGRAISISWPLWESDGMSVDSFVLDMIKRKYGLAPLPASQGMSLFNKALAMGFEHLVALYGDTEKIERSLRFDMSPEAESAKVPREKQSQSIAQLEDGKATVLTAVRQSLVKVLGLSDGDFDDDAEFSELGIDSIQMIGVMEELEKRLGRTIPPSALIDFPSVHALVSRLAQDCAAEIKAAPPTIASGAEIEESVPNLRTPLSTTDSPRGGYDVAVVACSGRFSGASDLHAYWDNLVNGRDVFTHSLPERWLYGGMSARVKGLLSAAYTTVGGYVPNVEYFDAARFGISDEEALVMDPQQRILLELCQELFDSAGYIAEELEGRSISVILGAKESPYVLNHLDQLKPSEARMILTSSLNNMLAGRLSHQFNLSGVSKTIDTACSSSLVAIDEAYNSIRSGTVEMAIAGGIFLMIDPYAHMAFSKAQVLSPDGRPAVFDQRANGFVLGEGAGLVMLKRLDKAMCDNDPIISVIRGSAVNNDGHTMGLTVPNQRSQRDVIERALLAGNIDPRTISYYEAHGTGTLLGDPIEVKAASEVYRSYSRDKQYCSIGSVKSNIGHTITAAGVASFIKILLSMKNGVIPATLHCSDPHPRFNFTESPFKPALRPQKWTVSGALRRAAISSFGFGGTNVHMVLEEASPQLRERNVRAKIVAQPYCGKRYWFGLKRVVPSARLSIDEIIGQVTRGEVDLNAAEVAIRGG